MNRSHLVFVFLLLVYSSVHADEGDKSNQQAEPQRERRTIQLGVGSLLLLSETHVRTDLDLSEQQKMALDKATIHCLRQMQGLGPRFRLAQKLAEQPRNAEIVKLGKLRKEMQGVFNIEAQKLLNQDQRIRLQQINLQLSGAPAISTTSSN